MKGGAYVHFTRSHGSGDDRKTDHYRNKETYVDSRVALVGDGNQRTVLHGGKHEYPFRFLLPNHIPSSFEGSFGHVRPNAVYKNVWLNYLECFQVRYEIKVEIDRPWAIDDSCTRPFTVISLVDLNLMQSVNVSRRKNNISLSLHGPV